MVGAPQKSPGSPGQSLNKPRPSLTQKESGPGGARRPGTFPLAVRILLTLLIVWHFAGVFLAALSVPVSSPLVYRIAQQPPMQWYLDALYMNQGHSFFAPDVGPGHLIRYELFDQSGQVLQQGQLPDDERHWPRLRYHRHFMLADQAAIPADDRQLRDQWQRAYLEHYARHLLRVHQDAESIRLRRIAHWPTPRQLVLDGRKIDDPEGYELLMEVTQRRTDLGPPPAEPANAWQGRRPMDTANRWIGVPR
jgi:hypothetical protein